MGFQEIKEEVISRKLLGYSEVIHNSLPIINEILVGLSRKNHFLTEVSDYSNNLDVEKFVIFLESLLDDKADDVKKKLYYEENFDQIIATSIKWIRKNTLKNQR
ncbi:MAG: hypothetical protein ACYCSO_04260 [Cuniculiplasma sp.]